LQFFFQKNIQFFSAVNFFQFLIFKTLDSELDPVPQFGKMLDPDPSALNQCGSTTPFIGKWTSEERRER
jgi:hypothetical protein